MKKFAGERILDFCQNALIILLTELRPRTNLINEEKKNGNLEFEDRESSENNFQPFQNRLKRNVFTKQNSTHNDRKIRQTIPFRGRFKGQTQAQYMNSNSNGPKDGKAEAEATQQSSRAVVSK